MRWYLLLFFTLLAPLWSATVFAQCTNVALGKPVTTNGVYLSYVPPNAVDGNCATLWNSGNYAPGFIQVDLQGTFTINNINVKFEMSPNGNVNHQVLTSPDMVTWSVADVITGYYVTGQLIERCYSNAPLTNVRGVRINSLSSPSWIAITDMGIYTLSSPTIPTITASGPLTFCAGGSVTLTSSAAASYVWSTGATTQSITVSASGTYSVTTSQAPSCVQGSLPCTTCGTGTASETVTVTPLPVISTGPAQTICDEETATLTVSGNYSPSATFLWSGPNGYSSTDENPSIANVTVAHSGSYAITVTDNGCPSLPATADLNVQDCVVPPVLDVPDNTNYCGNNHCQTVSPNLTITDPDNLGLDGAMVYFNSGYVTGEDVLQFTPQAGITGTFNAATGVITFSGHATAAQYEQVLRSVCYINTSTSASQGEREVYFVLGELLFNSDNAHYYKLVNHGSNICWTAARAAAAASTYFNMQGYLVTVTTQAENDFLAQMIQTDTWTGASDLAQEGVWRWVTGCEGLEDNGQGRHFFTDSPGCDHPGGGAPVGANFSAWNVNQPDNAGCLEHYMQFVPGTGGKWNDLPNCHPVARYIVEYGCMPNDPPLQIAQSSVIDVSEPYAVQRQASICENETYTLPGGQTVSVAGTYIDALQTAHGCDSIITTTVSITANTLVATGDAAICLGEAVQLNATGGLEYTWTPTAGLTNPTIANPIASPTTTTAYVVRSFVEGENLITNGDFEQGNVGFSSSYVYSNPNPLGGPSHYTVSTYVSNGWWQNCIDHTSGSGNMLIVDGADGSAGVPPGATLWCQTVNILPNRDYAFSTWLTNLNNSGATSQLRFTINGTQVGAIQNTPLGPCQWNQFYVIWNSGTSTSANICIAEASGAQPGNDFALDDIVFSPLCTYYDTVMVVVNQPAQTQQDPIICDNEMFTLPNGMDVNVSGIYTDTLQTIHNCDSIITTNLTVYPASSTSLSPEICTGDTYTLAGGTTVSLAGTYIDTLQTTHGCDSIITTELTLLPVDVITVDPIICQGETYTLPDGASVSTSGTYIATLTNAFGCDSIITTELTVNPSPVETIAVSICAYDSVLTAGYWKSAIGTYNDTLQTPLGCDSVVITVLTHHPSPVAAITVGNSCLDVPLVVNDASTISSGTVVSWDWNFGNGITSTQQQPPSQLYPSAGIYTVDLIVSSNNGCVDSAQADVEIYPLPVPLFSWDSVCAGLPITFTDLSEDNGTYPITSWNWTFSNGQTSAQQNPTVLFGAAGPYAATLNVTSAVGCKADTTLGDALVYPEPVAVILAPESHCLLDTAFFAEASTVDTQWGDSLVSWQWELENGVSSNLQTPSHVFSSPGMNTVSLTVETAHGCNHSMSATVEVFDRPTVAFQPSETDGCEPLTVLYMDQSTIAAPYSIAQWHWQLAVGEVSAERSPSYTHAYHGVDGILPDTVDVTLWVVSVNGCGSVDTAATRIVVYPLPTAEFNINPAKTDIIDPRITFTDLSTPNVTHWDWRFGDGYSSTEQNIVYAYADTGTYRITLTVATEYGCTDTAYSKVVIEPHFSFYIPNSFTPNSDRHNDVFRGNGEGYTDHFMSIFTRWGEEIYAGSGEVGWDGTFKGAQVEVGVYEYVITLRSWDGNERRFTGHVNLVR